MAPDDPAQLEAQGDLKRALAGYVASKQWAAAGRLAVKMERHREAAGYFLQADQPYEAAVCFQKAQDPKQCLEALLQVSQKSPRYRAACLHAIRVCLAVGESPQKLTAFVAPFINSPPASPAEAVAFNQIAAALHRTDRSRVARLIYERVIAAFPDNEDARDALALIPLNAPASRKTPAPNDRPAPMTTATGALRAIKNLRDILVSRGWVTPADLARASDALPPNSGDAALGEALVADGCLRDIDLVRALSEQSRTPFITEERLLATASPDALKLLGLEQVERWETVPVVQIDKQLYVAMRDPRNMTLIDQIRFASGAGRVNGIFATEGAIRKAIGKFYRGEDVTLDQSWKGKVWEMPTGASERFSDRVTKTREREFDTQEMMLRADLDAAAGIEPPPGMPALVTPPARLTAAPSATLVVPNLGATPAPPSGSGGGVDLGATFASRYRLEALLGEGGSASVYRAIDLELDEPVAIKIFRPWMQSEAMVSRFKTELSLSRQINHPNIIRLFDMGVADGLRYLTMELLEGTDLASRLGTPPKPMAIGDGLKILEQASAGLQAVHDRGVIHRDVKPQNLFVTNEGVVKVMDFGIAKKEQAQGVTMAGAVIGTPEFMSPEQVNGSGDLTHHTDLYSLGVTAYMMFTGEPPFTGSALVSILMAHVNNAPRSPREKNSAIPPALDAAILRLLEKPVEKRFGSCRELADALRQIRTQLPATA